MRTNEKGQVLLITLLMLAVVSTIVIGVVSRTSKETAITDQSEEASRAFSAAEAGIEQTLKTGTAVTNSNIAAENSKFSTTVDSNVISDTGVYVLPRLVKKDQVEAVWLAGHNADGTLNLSTGFRKPYLGICWSTNNNAVKPRLVVTAISYNGSQYVTHNMGLGLSNDSPSYENNQFLQITENSTIDSACSNALGINTGDIESMLYPLPPAVCGVTPGNMGLALNNPANCPTSYPVVLRVKPVYGDARIGIFQDAAAAPAPGLPSQGQVISSTGVSPDGVTTSKIKVTTSYRFPSSIFDYVLYSQGSGGLTK